MLSMAQPGKWLRSVNFSYPVRRSPAPALGFLEPAQQLGVQILLAGNLHRVGVTRRSNLKRLDDPLMLQRAAQDESQPQAVLLDPHPAKVGPRRQVDPALDGIHPQLAGFLQFRAQRLKERFQPGRFALEVGLDRDRAAGMRLTPLREFPLADGTLP